MTVPTIDVARWRLTGELEGVTNHGPVHGSITVQIVQSYIDPATGITVLAVDPVRGNFRPLRNGVIDVPIPSGQQAAVTIRIENGPALHALIEPRTTDATVAEAVTSWSSTPTWATGSAAASIDVPIPHWSATYGG